MRLILPSRMSDTIQKAIFLIIGKIKAAINGLIRRASNMPIPSKMSDLSVTESANSPLGTDAVSNSLDNYLRAVQAILRTTNNKAADIASGASVAIGAATGEFITITGTTTITSFDSISAGIVRDLLFSGELIITHSANIQLPGSINYKTVPGDVLRFRSLGLGQWICVGIKSAGGTYTPSTSGLINCSDPVNFSATWSRTGNLVTVVGAGRVRITSANTGTGFVISKPIATSASALSAIFGSCDMIKFNSSSSTAGKVYFDSGNAICTFSSGNGTAGVTQDIGFCFTYVIS